MTSNYDEYGHEEDEEYGYDLQEVRSHGRVSPHKDTEEIEETVEGRRDSICTVDTVILDDEILQQGFQQHVEGSSPLDKGPEACLSPRPDYGCGDCRKSFYKPYDLYRHQKM